VVPCVCRGTRRGCLSGTLFCHLKLRDGRWMERGERVQRRNNYRMNDDAALYYCIPTHLVNRRSIQPVLPVNDTYYRNKEFCKLSPLNGDCRSEEDCESGLICDSEGFCMNAECSDNDDCDGGFCVEVRENEN
jgi:hypothetical protein